MGPGRVSPTRFPGAIADGRAVVRGPGRHGGLGAHGSWDRGATARASAAAAVARAGRRLSPGAAQRMPSGAAGAETKGSAGRGFSASPRVSRAERSAQRWDVRSVRRSPCAAWGPGRKEGAGLWWARPPRSARSRRSRWLGA